MLWRVPRSIHCSRCNCRAQAGHSPNSQTRRCKTPSISNSSWLILSDSALRGSFPSKQGLELRKPRIWSLSTKQMCVCSSQVSSRPLCTAIGRGSEGVSTTGNEGKRSEYVRTGANRPLDTGSPEDAVSRYPATSAEGV